MKKLILIILIFFGSVAVYAADPYFLFSPKGVAEIEIKMLNGKKWGDIWVKGCIIDGEGNLLPNYQDKDAEKLEATMTIKNSTQPGSTSDYGTSELYNGKILIRGRGNTSFHNPKRAYSIDLIMNYNDTNDEYIDNPKPLLGMSSNEKWTLISRYEDRTIMRDMLAFWLGRQMKGIDYTPDAKYVEVTVINNDNTKNYLGLYCLSEKISRDDKRVDVKKLTADPADQVEPRVSGGYILEVVPNDKMKDIDDYQTRFPMPGFEYNTSHNYVFIYPKSKNVTNDQRDYIIQYMTEVYNSLYDNNFTDTITGYVNYIDENSFIDWCILHDLSKGVDNLFHASIYMQKNRNEKLRMTAPWDFDLSFGNPLGGTANECYYENDFWMRRTHYFHRLWEDPRFREKLKKRYDDLMPLFDVVPYVLQENYEFLNSCGALQRDYNKFGQSCLASYNPEDKINDNGSTKTINNVSTRKGQVQYLTDWFESRKAWIYYNLGETPEERCERMQQVRPVMRVLEPEKLWNCQSAYTRFMRGYTYNLTKGPDTQGGLSYVSDWYQIKRNDGEYTVQIVENGCVSIPSLPVQFCEERTYAEPQKPVIPNPVPQPPRISEPPPPPPPPPSAVQTIAAENITIFPNPASEYIYIDSGKDIFVELFDIKGIKLKQTTNDYLNVSDLASGIYFVKLTSKTKIINKKVVISH